MAWSKSTSPPSLTGSSGSSSSNSSDSGFSLICAGGPAGIGRPELKSDRMTTAMLRARFVNRACLAGHPPQWIRTHVSVDQVVHLEDGQQHCKNDAHDKQAHEDDEHRTQEPHERRQDRVELTFLADRGPLEHALELPARLAAGNKVNGHGGKHPARRQRAAACGDFPPPPRRRQRTLAATRTPSTNCAHHIFSLQSTHQ